METTEYVFTNYDTYKTASIAEKATIKTAILASENAMLLMSAAEFASGGKDVKDVPICITPDGMAPKFEVMAEAR